MLFRRISGYLLMVCLMAPLVISYSWFSWKREHIRQEIRAQIRKGLSRDQMVQLSFSKEQLPGLLHWEKEDEFKYNGEMYDVVETEYSSDSLHYWCIHDHGESQLNQRFASMLAGLLDHEPMTKQARQRLITFLSIQYTPDYFSWIPDIIENEIHLSKWINLPAGTFLLEPVDPPPRVS